MQINPCLGMYTGHASCICGCVLYTAARDTVQPNGAISDFD